MSLAPRRLGKYELRENVGRGGILEVWKAFDTEAQQDVTIKLFRPDLHNDPHFLTRFENEARKVASLHHPNIVQVRDFQVSRLSESESAIAYLVTDAVDLVKGLRLADYIGATSGTKKFPPWEIIVQFFTAISKAIDYAHQQGVIHRNINPTNILLDTANTSRNPVGEPVLTDFGMATILGTSSSPRPGMFQGNPAYISPEQVQGYPGNEFSDLYSLGIILYQMCTGALPFQGDNPSALRMQQVNATPAPPALFRPDIPPPLTLLLLHSLTKDPAGRFPNAATLTAELAEVLNIPVPDDLSLFVSLPDARDMPTYLTPGQLNLPSARTPSSPSLPPMGGGSSSPFPAVALSTPSGGSASSLSASALPQAVLTTPPLSAPPGNGPITPTPSIDDIVGVPPVRSTPTPSGIPTVVLKPTGGLPIPPSTTLRRGLMLALIGMVVLLLGASVLGAFSLLPGIWSTAVKPSGPIIVGHAFFLNSGQVSQNSDRGLNDGLKITLENLAAPAAGKSYSAWLLNEQTGSGEVAILLGPLAVKNGTATLIYSDKNHTNLLAHASRLLITEENANTSPVSPSLDKKTWKYVAAFSQKVAPGATYSVLAHLRHLLAADPKLDTLGLRGGLAIWFTRNVEKVMIWAGTARDDWKSKDTQQMRQQLIRILDVLDSASYVQKVGDVPPGTPLLINTPVALLEFDIQNQNPPGYLEHISQHLKALISTPGATQTQIKLAREIMKALNTVLHWLEQVHQDARQLLQISDPTQLLTSASRTVLNDMAAQALYAYVGQLDPATNQVVKGATQIHNDMVRLATFDVTPYTSR